MVKWNTVSSTIRQFQVAEKVHLHSSTYYLNNHITKTNELVSTTATVILNKLGYKIDITACRECTLGGGRTGHRVKKVWRDVARQCHIGKHPTASLKCEEFNSTRTKLRTTWIDYRKV